MKSRASDQFLRTLCHVKFVGYLICDTISPAKAAIILTR